MTTATAHHRIVAEPGIPSVTMEREVAASRDLGEVRQFVGADSLAHLSLDALVEATEAPASALCRAC